MKTRTRFVAASIALGFLAAAGPVSAAPTPTEFFLHIDGIDGGSRQVDHQKWIDIEGFVLDLSHPLGQAPVLGPVRVAKRLDRATVGLSMAALSGAALPPFAVIDACAPIGAGDLKTLFRVELGSPFITAVQPEQGGKDAAEVVVFDGYSEIKLTYYIYNGAGVLLGKVSQTYP
jgi:type VI protein secretion system component Hcp